MVAARATVQTSGRRRRSESKQATILDAAEALFASEGYEVTSVDAIAARAKVSKRTIYDHFGDKQALFQSVLVRVGDSLTATVRQVIDEELTQGRDLHAALTAFALRIATEAFPLSDYVTFRRLTSRWQAAPRLPEGAGEHPERSLEERFAELAADGELRVANPRRAVQHFKALTLLLALDALDDDPAGSVENPEISAIIADGVEMFLRAYR